MPVAALPNETVLKGTDQKGAKGIRINIWIRLYDAGGYFSLWLVQDEVVASSTLLQLAREAQERSSK